MNNTLYLECYSGISGDMTVAALLDLGADQNVLEKALKSIPVGGFEVKISRVKKAGLDVCDFSVILEEEYENHDHDMNYLHGTIEHHYGVEHNHNAEHHHDLENIQEAESRQETEQHQEKKHSHETEHRQEVKHYQETEYNSKHNHKHRGLNEILDIVNQAEITPKAKDLTTRIFTILAQAEAKAHGVEQNEVHFHEVGAIDSIVDIVAVSVCLDNLDITQVIVPELYEGRGFVRCQHGMIPIPVPAVVHIAVKYGLNLHLTSTEGELVTPTGAAIVAAIRTSEKLPKKFTIEKMGIGAGKRTYDRPSMLRAMLIKNNAAENDTIYKLESNIDDCSGEVLGFVMERLFEAGAKDVHYLPAFMKKNRPAYQLNVICKEEDIEKLEQIIFEETTTIGIRRVEMERTVLERTMINRLTSLGEVKVKVCKMNYGIKIYPEYSSVVELCKIHNMSYQDVFYLIQEECKELVTIQLL